jgi:3-deoxy-D-manno-octulosonate 8-phosphate phosphatase (KDO 8-P phosphatase)
MGEVDYGRIELLVLDVDGVLTDGRITLTGEGDEIKNFHVRDGAGMKYWKRAGGKLALITGRGCPAVTRRAKELDVDVVRMHAKNKLPVLREILDEIGIGPGAAAVMADDLTDIPLMRHCGFSAAVADAVDEVRRRASYVTAACGGCGAVRELIELILKRSGRWDAIMARYIGDEGE